MRIYKRNMTLKRGATIIPLINNNKLKKKMSIRKGQFNLGDSSRSIKVRETRR